jgi:hypothetical protein
VVIESNKELEEAVNVHGEHIAAQVLANSISIGDASAGVDTDFGEFKAKLLIEKAQI